MARLRFNKAILGIVSPGVGVTLSPKDIVPGTGTIEITDDIKNVTTLDHLIHRVKIGEKGIAKIAVFGDKESLATQSTALDIDNFGGTHQFYLDASLVYAFDGLVEAEYNTERRITSIKITGEYDA